eukprot:g2154.t1
MRQVWYDNRAEDLTKEGMRKGIEQAAAFVLFLSEGALNRPYVQYEIRQAMKLKKPMVLIHESDSRKSGEYDFDVEREKAPSDLAELLDSHESLAFRRRGYERDALLQTVIRRAGFWRLYDEANSGDADQNGGAADKNGDDSAKPRRKPGDMNGGSGLTTAAAGLAACACAAYAYSSAAKKSKSGVRGGRVANRLPTTDEKTLLPVHLRDKSLTELVEHFLMLNSKPFDAPGVREEKIAMHASQVASASENSVSSFSSEGYVDMVHKTLEGYDPTRGELYARNADGSLRMDIKEMIPDKLVRITVVAGSEMVRLDPVHGDGVGYMNRVDFGFNECKKIESYFHHSNKHIPPGTTLPSEEGLLPVHLRNKSIVELAEHLLMLENLGFDSPEVREEKIAMHALQVTKSTRKSVFQLTAEEYVESMEKWAEGYDPTRGELWATDANGKVRADLEESIPGKIVRVTSVAGSEMVRLNRPPDGASGYLERVDMGFNEHKKIESYFTASHIPGTTLPGEEAFLPAHLQDKSLTELVEHLFLLENQGVEDRPDVRAEMNAMLAPELTLSTATVRGSIKGVYPFTIDEAQEATEKTHEGYDPTRGEMWATNADGTLRADIREVVPGKQVRITAVEGPEALRLHHPGDGEAGYMSQMDISFNENKKIESFVITRNIPGTTLPSEDSGLPPEHLREKSLAERAQHVFLLDNRRLEPGVREEHIAMHASELTANTETGIFTYSPEEWWDVCSRVYDGYNPTRGELWAMNADGTPRMDAEELIPGKLVRMTMVEGSEMLRLHPKPGASTATWLARVDVTFNEDRNIVSYVNTRNIAGTLPSEEGLLPVHLRDKSLVELVEHMLLLENQGDSTPGAREERIAMQAAEVTMSTEKGVFTYSTEEAWDMIQKSHEGYDPLRGELWATEPDGTLRADIEEVIPGKVVRMTLVEGSENLRLHHPGDGDRGYMQRIELSFNEHKKIESYVLIRNIPGSTLPSEELGLLPVHLRDKSLPELMAYSMELENQGFSVREERLVLFAPELTISTEKGVFSYSPEEYWDVIEKSHEGYDPMRGELWARNADGTLRADIEEVIPGKVVRAILVEGSEMNRLHHPKAGDSKFMTRCDATFNKNKKVESMVFQRNIPGSTLPSEQTLLPVHLRDKSAAELVEQLFLLLNRPSHRQQKIAMHAPQVTVSTEADECSYSAKEWIDAFAETYYTDFDPSQGELYATNTNGTLRAEIEEVISGKLVRVTLAIGSRMIRMNPGSDEGGERNILRADIGFNDNKQIESYFTSRRILPGRRGTKSRL